MSDTVPAKSAREKYLRAHLSEVMEAGTQLNIKTFKRKVLKVSSLGILSC